MTTVNDFVAAGLEQVRKSWGWFLVSGIALMILGVVCVGKAQTATTFSILALGWILAVSAVFWFVSSFYAFSWQGFFLYLLNALIRGVTGYLLIRHPNAGAEGVTMVLAVLFIVGGIFRASAAGTIRFPRWGWTLFAGLVSVALGIYLLARFPATSVYFVGLAIGIDLIFDGGSLVGFAGAIHSLPSKHANQRRLTTAAVERSSAVEPSSRRLSRLVEADTRRAFWRLLPTRSACRVR